MDAAGNPYKLGTIIDKVFTLINANIFAIASILLVVFVIIAGVRRMMGDGSSQAIKDSNATLQWAIIGYVLVMLAYFLVKFVGQFLGYTGGIGYTL